MKPVYEDHRLEAEVFNSPRPSPLHPARCSRVD